MLLHNEELFYTKRNSIVLVWSFEAAQYVGNNVAVA